MRIAGQRIEEHKVMVMHKQVDGRLAIGKTFEFPTGDSYQVQPNGSVRKVGHKLTNSDKRRMKREAAEKLKPQMDADSHR